MEENRSDIVQMPGKREETPFCVVIPDLDPIIISTRNKEGLCLVKVDSSDGPIMLLESVNQCAHTVVP